ncbi:uncharacterized protein LOC132748924 isoform X2 [Ruditapes philippinarum]|uniref:uncharacterized protein LOC132748924 isoform X2 n=1 Tax=Ruditapes philippinarum TaxID=129788 RepID=UPI00295BBB8D|nr:uncharacterized protein LOC132748924 isoform X2 [Ruditapes philippinarum]
MDTKNEEMEIDSKEDEFLTHVETEFIGREFDMQAIAKAWKYHRILGLFGLRSVGKSRLVHVFLSRYITDVTLLDIDLKQFGNISALYSYFCIQLGTRVVYDAHKSDWWIQHIVKELIHKNDKDFVIVFDNTEDFQEVKGTTARDLFLSLSWNIIKRCNNVKVIITSTTSVKFVAKTFFSYTLEPLTFTDSCHLLRSVAPDINFGEYEDAIVTLSDGLPLLILMIGSELKNNDEMTPCHMVQCLQTSRLKTLSDTLYPKEDRIADVYKSFIDRLALKYKEHLTVLDYIPGSFSVDECREIIDVETTEAMVKFKTIKPLLDRHVLDRDSATKRLNIQGILRECLKSYYTVKDLPKVRARYSKIFTAVMVRISSRLYTPEYTKAVAELTIEYPNLQKLLTDVEYTTQDTYHFFIKVATDCTGLVDNFMAGEGEVFYQGCMKIADMYGKEIDRANVHIAVGSFYTNVKCHLEQGADNYDAALNVLEKYGKSLQLATANQRKGWNLLMQGKNLAATVFLKNAFDLSNSSGTDFQSIVLQSLNSLGITNTVLGRFDEAEKYHFEALRRRKQIQGETHPFVGACLNNIGIMYYQKGDWHKALEFYEAGLDIKRKNQTPAWSLVNSLSNTANMYSETGESAKAMQLLNEALELLNKEKLPPKESFALIYDTIGKVYRRDENLTSAEDMFQKAINIRGEISMENVTYLESLVHLADIHKRQKHYISCIKVSNKALQIKETAEKAMPQNPFVKECFECLAEVYNLSGSNDKYIETLEKLQSELIRLERVHLDHGNDRDLLKVRKEMQSVTETIQRVSYETKSR